jgi:predicted peroxiredoxin
MSEPPKELVVLMTKGSDHELSSVAFTIANGGITGGLKVYAFLTSASVDLVGKRAADVPHVPPLDPLKVGRAAFGAGNGLRRQLDQFSIIKPMWSCRDENGRLRPRRSSDSAY